MKPTKPIRIGYSKISHSIKIKHVRQAGNFLMLTALILIPVVPLLFGAINAQRLYAKRQTAQAAIEQAAYTYVVAEYRGASNQQGSGQPQSANLPANSVFFNNLALASGGFYCDDPSYTQQGDTLVAATDCYLDKMGFTSPIADSFPVSAGVAFLSPGVRKRFSSPIDISFYFAGLTGSCNVGNLVSGAGGVSPSTYSAPFRHCTSSQNFVLGIPKFYEIAVDVLLEKAEGWDVTQDWDLPVTSEGFRLTRFFLFHNGAWDLNPVIPMNSFSRDPSHCIYARYVPQNTAAQGSTNPLHLYLRNYLRDWALDSSAPRASSSSGSSGGNQTSGYTYEFLFDLEDTYILDLAGIGRWDNYNYNYWLTSSCKSNNRPVLGYITDLATIGRQVESFTSQSSSFLVNGTYASIVEGMSKFLTANSRDIQTSSRFILTTNGARDKAPRPTPSFGSSRRFSPLEDVYTRDVKRVMLFATSGSVWPMKNLGDTEPNDFYAFKRTDPFFHYINREVFTPADPKNYPNFQNLRTGPDYNSTMAAANYPVTAPDFLDFTKRPRPFPAADRPFPVELFQPLPILNNTYLNNISNGHRDAEMAMLYFCDIATRQRGGDSQGGTYFTFDRIAFLGNLGYTAPGAGDPRLSPRGTVVPWMQRCAKDDSRFYNGDGTAAKLASLSEPELRQALSEYYDKIFEPFLEDVQGGSGSSSSSSSGAVGIGMTR